MAHRKNLADFDSAFRLIQVDFDTGTGVCLVRDPGAVLCAEILPLSKQQLDEVIQSKSYEAAKPGSIIYRRRVNSAHLAPFVPNRPLRAQQELA